MKRYSCAIHEAFMIVVQGQPMRSSLRFLPVYLAAAVCGLSAATPLIVDAPDSKFEIDVKATMGSFVGYLADYAADIQVETATGEVESAVLAFDFREVKTGEEKRDHHMHVWQETDKFSHCCWEMTHLEPQPDGSHLAAGKLTLHGVTRPLTFPVEISREGGLMVIDGEVELNTEAFGLPIIRKFLALKVNPIVEIRFHLQGHLGESSA